MNDSSSSPLIDVQFLRIGMFIHLDLGWMAHPFPLSNFKITSAEQIATIRKLGLPKVRWVPEKSDADPAEALAAEEAAKAAAAAIAAAESPEARARRLHREAVIAERAAMQLCERQFAEASRACKQTMELVLAQPEKASHQAHALTQAMVDKLIGQQEVCIRLLTDAAGDKTSLHAVNVAVVSLLMGKTFGLSEPELMDLGLGAMLHDVGKLELPDRLRHRDDHFTQTELHQYQEHVPHGVNLARTMSLSPGAALIIGQHHEHADGSGFPLRINSDRMSPGSRIVSLVNRYDNLCNPHIASRALTPHEALSLLFAQGKTKFDTAILGAFIKMMGVYPPGSTVQLTDDRYALVMSVNAVRPLKPRVLVHDPKVPRDEALLLDLERSPRLGIRRSIKPQQLPTDSVNYLSPRARVTYFFEPAPPTEMAA
jgi:HD-GYP domain-containing protein (c-di-GMP phosphodiesterase class II)